MTDEAKLYSESELQARIDATAAKIRHDERKRLLKTHANVDGMPRLRIDAAVTRADRLIATLRELAGELVDESLDPAELLLKAEAVERMMRALEEWLAAAEMGKLPAAR